MIFLSDSAVRYAVEICRERSNYKVGIAPNSQDSRNNAKEIILSLIDNEEVQRVRNSSYYFQVIFKNGSTIDFLSASDNARGKRIHLLIADKSIPIEIIDTVLRKCEILERYEYWLEKTNNVARNRHRDSMEIITDETNRCRSNPQLLR